MCPYACANAQGRLLKGARDKPAALRLIGRVQARRRREPEPAPAVAAPPTLEPA